MNHEQKIETRFSFYSVNTSTWRRPNGINTAVTSARRRWEMCFRALTALTLMMIVIDQCKNLERALFNARNRSSRGGRDIHSLWESGLLYQVANLLSNEYGPQRHAIDRYLARASE
jgi:hypothetical protein